MNGAFFGFPTSNDYINIQEFESSGTWIKPKGAKMVMVYLVGGGSGGGGGNVRSVTAGSISGGAGGGGGNGGTVWYDAAMLPNEVPVIIGAGGAGGLPAIHVNGAQTQAAGNGVNGNNSFFGNWPTHNSTHNPGIGYWLSARGGRFGNAGSTTGGSTGGAGWNWAGAGAGNGGAGVFAGNGNSANPLMYMGPGGGAGGGISATLAFKGGYGGGGSNVDHNGGGGGGHWGAAEQNGVLQSTGVTDPTWGRQKYGGNGKDELSTTYWSSAAVYVTNLFRPFSGGGGGGGGGAWNNGASDTTAGNGGGGYHGGAGGGGGSCYGLSNTHTHTAGAGGRGGNGYCRITTIL